MNSTLTRDERHSHSPTIERSNEHSTNPSIPQSVERPARRLGLVDRAALQLGMALIRWGRRPGRELARYERRANRLELGVLHHERQLARREHEIERSRGVEGHITRIF